jgi:hypothetical protein
VNHRIHHYIEKLRHAAGGSHFSPARRLLLAGSVLGAAGLGWFWSRRADAYTAESVVQAVCDRLLPAWEEHPGALATEIDRMVLEDLTRMSDGARLQSLVAAMREVRFLTLVEGERDATLRTMLGARDEAGISRTLQFMLNQSVRYYFSHPDSWHALDYRQPQPLGYPDYATCTTRKS